MGKCATSCRARASGQSRGRGPASSHGAPHASGSQHPLSQSLALCPPGDRSAASMRARLRGMRSAIFHANGSVDVTIRARWTDKSGEPSAGSDCGHSAEYTVTLMKGGGRSAADVDLGTRIVRIGDTARLSWSPVPDGDYYLKLRVDNSSDVCCLVADIT